MRRLIITLLLPGLFAGCDQTASERAPSVASKPIADWAVRIDTLAGEYTRVMNPAEFWDSILIVPDVAESRLWKVNVITGERTLFASRGSGPGEYPLVGWAMKVHSDSVAITQVRALMPFPVLSVATGLGRTQTFAPAYDADALTRVVRMHQRSVVRYADTLGNLYASAARESDRNGRRLWPEMLADEAVVTTPRLRLSLRGQRIDSSGLVPLPLQTAERVKPGAGDGRALKAVGPYSPYNSWVVLPDGRSVLAGGASYTLEVMQVSGALDGPWSVDYPRIAASSEGYNTWVEDNRRRTAGLLTQTLLGVDVPKLPRRQQREYEPMPTYLPPLNFAGIRSMHGSGDVAWVPVHVEDPPVRETWDLVHIGRRTRICRVALDRNHRLLLVTANGTYVAVQNELDLERIVRFQASTWSCAMETG